MHHIKVSIKAEVRKSYGYIIFLSLLIVPLFFLTACGKKGDPTLKEFEKPVAPSSLKAVHREEKLVLLWNYPKEKETAIEDFIILKSSGSEFVKLPPVEKSKHTYEDTDFKTGITYSYKIVARNLKGVNSSDSDLVVVSPLPYHLLRLTFPSLSRAVFCCLGGSLLKRVFSITFSGALRRGNTGYPP